MSLAVDIQTLVLSQQLSDIRADAARARAQDIQYRRTLDRIAYVDQTNAILRGVIATRTAQAAARRRDDAVFTAVARAAARRHGRIA